MKIKTKIKHRYWRFEENLIGWCVKRYELKRELLLWSEQVESGDKHCPRGWEPDRDHFHGYRKMTLGDRFKRWLENMLESGARRWGKRCNLTAENPYKEWSDVVQGRVK